MTGQYPSNAGTVILSELLGVADSDLTILESLETNCPGSDVADGVMAPAFGRDALELADGKYGLLTVLSDDCATCVFTEGLCGITPGSEPGNEPVGMDAVGMDGAGIAGLGSVGANGSFGELFTRAEFWLNGLDETGGLVCHWTVGGMLACLLS